jgi:hypothetical protein
VNWGNRRKTDKDLSLWIDVDSKQIYIWNECLWHMTLWEFLNDLKFILYLKYDNFSTTWCMTRLLLLPIIYVRAHYIIQLEIHKNTSYFFGNTDAAVNRKTDKDLSLWIDVDSKQIYIWNECLWHMTLWLTCQTIRHLYTKYGLSTSSGNLLKYKAFYFELSFFP